MILTNGTIVELENHSSDDNGFAIDPAELLPHIRELAGTWHTHPDQSANLSVEDAETFVMWPDLTHYIVGTDGVRTYLVRRGAVING